MNGVVEYFRGAIHELRLVKWPTQQHAVRISIITVIFVVSAMLLLMVIDAILSQVNTAIYGSAPVPAAQAPATQTPVTIDPKDINIQATTASGEPVDLQVTTEAPALETEPVAVTDTAAEPAADAS